MAIYLFFVLLAVSNSFGEQYGAASEATDVPETADIEGINLAFRKIYSQSSTYTDHGVAGNAVDGHSSTRYSEGHCSHTGLNVNPWWSVDLTTEYQVTIVKITNRGDCCSHRINGAEIRIGLSSAHGGTRNPKCATVSSLGLGEEGVYECGKVGRYLTITIPNKAAYLTLCEVKVYGYMFSEIHPVPRVIKGSKSTGINLALRRNSSQSSTYNRDGAAENAVNGYGDTFYTGKPCSHTGLDVNPWWSVDLTFIYNVTTVKITVPYCCPDRINGAEIRIGLSSAHGGTRNPKCATISLRLGEEGVYECGMVGRYLTINIPNRAGHLELCEVEAYGQVVTGINATADIIEDSEEDTASEATDVPETEDIEGIDLAFQKISSQSSTYDLFGLAENAVGAYRTYSFTAGHCSKTALDVNPWWSVDLRSIYNVTTVRITNSRSGYNERINGAEIRIGLSSKHGGTKNPKCATISSLGHFEEGVYECGKVGRYLTITIPNRTEHLDMCKVKAYGHKVSGINATARVIKDSGEDTGINLALRRNSSQSSTFNHLGAAANAVDGHSSSDYMTGHCSHTARERFPWWSVDLIIVYNITTVKITNRGDCCSERIDGAEIRIGLTSEPGESKNPKCATISSLGPGEEGVYECGMVGRYLTIIIPSYRSVYLTLCEVKAYGHKVSEIDTSINLALRRNSSQSSTYCHLGAAENAVDGHSNTDYMKGHCSHTGLDVNPWWSVDLTNIYNVSLVTITNRAYWYSNRINGAEIRIGLSSEHGGTKNPKCATISSLGRGEEGVYECGKVGRYLTITIPNRVDLLTLCEVKAYGYEVTGINATAHVIEDSEEPTGSEATDVPETADKEASEATDVPETEDTEGINLAFRRISSQSSTYERHGVAANAIDGHGSFYYNTRYAMGHCSVTALDINPWWSVDLIIIYNVTTVKITNRDGCCSESLNGAEIRIGLSSKHGGTKNPKCATISSLGLEEEGVYECGKVGRYLTITIPNRTGHLTLCNMKVYGHNVSGINASEPTHSL